MFKGIHRWYFSALLLCAAVAAPGASACVVQSPILEVYNRNSNWRVLGFCVGDQEIMFRANDQLGRYQRFEHGMIFWHPHVGGYGNGGYEVHGAILQKYQNMGLWNGVLDLPVTDEFTTPDGTGKFNHFTGPTGWGGSIYWTLATGAHEVHGAIREKWKTLGWERGLPGGVVIGYPKTDELSTPDGRGKFNYFTGSNGFPAAIYSTKATGAHEVHGKILEAWANSGWETGPCGYPKSDEKEIYVNKSRYNEFEYGVIQWYPPGRGWPDGLVDVRCSR